LSSGQPGLRAAIERARMLGPDIPLCFVSTNKTFLVRRGTVALCHMTLIALRAGAFGRIRDLTKYNLTIRAQGRARAMRLRNISLGMLGALLVRPMAVRSRSPFRSARARTPRSRCCRSDTTRALPARRWPRPRSTFLISTPTRFGPLFKLLVDASDFAQLLYGLNVAIPNYGSRNVLDVATNRVFFMTPSFARESARNEPLVRKAPANQSTNAKLVWLNEILLIEDSRQAH
jgi:hypothetical protein